MLALHMCLYKYSVVTHILLELKEVKQVSVGAQNNSYFQRHKSNLFLNHFIFSAKVNVQTSKTCTKAQNGAGRKEIIKIQVSAT